ncbi:MAG TPA: hypothetical protein VFW65_35385 [Pseudonocardiaceae bacterium]|nr:hypothetical protein [Pseudonocardiaceae bacterium]
MLFHELTFVPEGDEVVVGRKDTGDYVVLPADGAGLLSQLVDGATPDEAAEWFEATFGEPVDITEFLDVLDELGFVRSADAPVPVESPEPVRLRRLSRVLFSRFAFACYLALVVVWFLVMTGHHDLLPRPSQMFFTSSLVIVQITVIFGQLPLIFLHEGCHVLAGRRLGLPSRLGVSNRWIYIVFETVMNSVMSVPRRQRYLPFLAGMLGDVLVVCLLDVTAQLAKNPDGSLSLVSRIALTFAFTVFVRLAWQFQLYLRTDLYYVFATALNCHDLHEASGVLLRNWIWRRLGRTDRVVDEGQWADRDRRVGRWYGPVMVLGLVVSLAVALLGSLPVVVQYAVLIVERLTSGRIDASFVDALVSLLMNVTVLVLPVVLSRRKRRRAAVGTLRTVPEKVG